MLQLLLLSHQYAAASLLDGNLNTLLLLLPV